MTFQLVFKSGPLKVDVIFYISVHLVHGREHVAIGSEQQSEVESSSSQPLWRCRGYFG